MREEYVYNADKTIFDPLALSSYASRGDTVIKYAGVMSRDMRMKIMITVGGGCRAKICVPLLIYKTHNLSYSILGLKDNVPDVTYRSITKGWLEKVIFSECLRFATILKPLPKTRKHIFYMDTGSAHKLNLDAFDALKRSCTELRVSLVSATDQLQPVDFFLIQRIKYECRNQ